LVGRDVPCYRCEARQVDPSKGPSDWKRGVVDGRQVLVCPQCQLDHDWTAALDRCADCNSTQLVRALGETRCRNCGATALASDLTSPTTADRGLAAEVSEALARRFGAAVDETGGDHAAPVATADAAAPTRPGTYPDRTVP
jgi:ribosomal protein S27E